MKAGFLLLCPKCGQGKLFKNPNPYNFKTIADMPDNCPHCNLSFMPEPGFYYGAMFMSYVVTVALSVLNFAWVYAIWGWATWRRAWQRYDAGMLEWPRLASSGWVMRSSRVGS